MSHRDRALADGERGEAAQMAMGIITRVATATGAERLIDVTRVHVDGCLYHGDAGLDFAERLVAAGAQVAIPTTLNVGTLDLLHPDLFRGDRRLRDRGRRLMDAYAAMGCEPTWTCAPYQLPRRPGFGEQIAWSESNAIVFANSVLGARTNRYGDFIDICAAITARVPDTGLHRTDNRRGEILFQITGVPDRLLDSDTLYPVLGHLIGGQTGRSVPVIDGLPPGLPEDRLKALGAAAASSGAVALFHAVGTTPEAPDLSGAFGGSEPVRTIEVGTEQLLEARDDLTTVTEGPLGAVSVGTPHFSLNEFETLAALIKGGSIHPDTAFYVNTSRAVLDRAELSGFVRPLIDAGVEIVTDTCTYVTPILRAREGVVMTNSAKWAYYAPSNLGVEVAFGSLEDCVRSATSGRIERDDEVWGG
jgi:predicted aconitase